MEQRPAQSVARERLLHVALPRVHLRSSVHTVTLQDRCVRMINPSDTQQQQQQQTQQQQKSPPEQTSTKDLPSSITHQTATETVTSCTTTSLPVTNVTSSSSSISETKSSTTSSSSLKPDESVSSTQTTTKSQQPSRESSISSKQTEQQQKQIIHVGSSKELTIPCSKSAPPSPSLLKPSSDNASTSSISSSASSTPSPSSSSLPSPSTTSAKPPKSPSPSRASSSRSIGGGGGVKEKEIESTDFTIIVGGKHPTDEDRLTLIVPDLQHGGTKVKAASVSPQTNSDWSASSWSEPHNTRQRSATTTSNFSTREQLLPGDQQPIRDKSNSEGKLSVQFSLSPPPKRDVAHVMEFFQEQEKNLQERFLSLPKHPPRKQRSPSPNIQQKLGLEHLDNLVRMMQQLTSLKDENSRLRKRCDYLESTKSLLQAKKELSVEEGGALGAIPKGTSLPSSSRLGHHTWSKQQQKHHQQQQQLQQLQHHYEQHQKQQQLKLLHAASTSQMLPGDRGGGARHRLSSNEEFDYLESVESSSDQRPKQTTKKTLHKRSFSTGSIEIDLLDSSEVTDISGDDRTDTKYQLVAKSGSKQKGKSSKWARVKKVLTGQKLYEDLNTTIKSLREFGKSTHLHRYSSAGTAPEKSTPDRRVYRRSDSIPAYGTDRDFDTQVAQPTYSGYQVMDTTEAIDLTSDIWMGPADWWEEYEASKESATSASSDVSSVIEVTTMYLGDGTQPETASQTTTTTTTATRTSSSPSVSSTSTTKPAKKILVKQDSLSVEMAATGLRRRKSSPALSINDDDDDDDDYEDDDESLLELASKTEPMRFLHKSSSCKSADLDLPKSSWDIKQSAKKFHRTAWGRVKDIIHTRKGSIKRKPRKDKSSSGVLTEPEESSEVDMEALLDEGWHHDLFAEGLLSRSTPKSSPMVIRQTQQGGEVGVTAKGSAEQHPEATAVGGLSKSMSATASTSPVDMAALLGRSMSDDFNKKMQEWEEMKSRKASAKPSVDDSELCSLDVSSTSRELQTVDLRDLRGSIPEAGSDSLVTDESNTSIEVLGLPVVTEDMAKKKMSESFSRKMQEWERMKYKGSPGPLREPSPEMERKGSKGRKDDRQKSKRSREEKEKEKLEKHREREMQKVERERVKLEKEMLRIEKERLRALEREAKLEKLKGRLSQVDTENMTKNPVLSPLAEYKVTSDFAHKLHEWELRKGLSHAVSNSVYLEAHKIKSQLKEGLPPEASPREDSVSFTFDPAGGDTQHGDSVALQPFWESPEDTSPIEKFSETSLDETSVTAEETRTAANIPTLERANAGLLQELRKKELEYQTVQDEVQNLNDKLSKVKEEHTAEMARFHQQLKEGVVIEPVKLEMGELERTIGHVEEKIQLMENFGESIAKSMESAAVGKWQSIEGEESVHMQLVELVAQMRNMLIQATQSEQASQKTSALANFEVLYSQAMKLQVQMNNLRLSHLERNREIMVIKRQLLLQEVNNLVLQADITRREAELYQFQQAKQFSSLRRWNTFSGYRSDRHRPQAQIELPSALAKPKTDGGMTKSLSDRDSKMTRFQEQGVPVTKASASAPCSPLAKTTVEEELAFLDDDDDDDAGAGISQSPTTTQALPPSGSRSSSNDNAPVVTRQQHQQQPGGDSATQPLVEATASGIPKPKLYSQDEEREEGYQKSSSDIIDQCNTTISDDLAPKSPTDGESDNKTSVSKSSRDQTSKSLLQDQKQQQQQEQQQKQLLTQAPGSPLSSPERIGSKDVKFALDQISALAEFKTKFDSVPLQQQIEALRKEKAEVEKGSATSMSRSESSPAAPSAGRRVSPKLGAAGAEEETQTLTQTIPKQSASLDASSKPKLQKTAAQIIDEDFPYTAQSVIECTAVAHSPTTTSTTSTDHTILPLSTTNTTTATITSTHPSGAGEGEASLLSSSSYTTTSASPPSPSHLCTLPPISDQSRAGSRSPRSPVSKHKLLRRQKEKEERDIMKPKDYSAISPMGSPVAARGKPPLPRQDRAFRHSPSSSPSISDRGSRSKSHEEVESITARSQTSSNKHLQDAINKFEKRATICETEDRPVELRKTPSPTLHLPRVGLVSRVRKLKPAAELLEESQRYRSGQSIYATRIMPKYLPKEESRSPDAQQQQVPKHNKENVSGSYVHAMVQRLSRESTPARSGGSSRSTSSTSLHRMDAQRSQSEFVSHIVRKLSSSSGPESPSSPTIPLTDVTNEGHVRELTSAYDSKSSLASGKVKHRDPSHLSSSTSAQHTPERRSCEVAMVLQSTQKQSPSEAESYVIVSAVSTGSVALPCESSSKTVTSPIPTNHKSLPSLTPSTSHPASPSSYQSSTSSRKAAMHRKDVSFDVDPEFSSVTSGSSVFRSPSEEEEGGDVSDKSKRSKEKRKKGEPRRLLASLSPVRRTAGRGRGETVGFLCKQSISFDLGVSMYSKEDPPPPSSSSTPSASSSKTKGGFKVKTRKPRSWDPSDSVAAEAASAAAAQAKAAATAAPSTSASTSAIEMGGGGGRDSDVMTSSVEVEAEEAEEEEGGREEAAPSLPTATEKKKSKRFLDSAWLQKSKRFFKVSK